MVKILREADKAPVAEVAKKHEVSDQTIYSGRKRYGTRDPTDIGRPRQLEHENARPKKLLADRDFELDVMRAISRRNWSACRFGDNRLRTRRGVSCRGDERVRCCRLRGR